MLVCDLRRQSVAVFGKLHGEVRFLGAVSGHAGLPLVLVVLHLHDGEARARSHFQRLVLAEDVHRAEEQQRLQAAEERQQPVRGERSGHPAR